MGTIGKPNQLKTIGSFWPYATTIFDYVYTAMPYPETKSLSHEETYAVTAYLLEINGIIGENEVMNAQTLPKVKMPNRDNFIRYPGE
jgi:S-disulfanyl-L-cysteine oxidoreductase SoxD